MKNIVLVVLICLVTACTSARSYQSANSFLGVVPEEKSILKAIAGDMANYIATQYAPGHTSFNLITPKEEKAAIVDGVVIDDTFSVIFENALRQKGFEISKKGIELSYTIDSLEEGFYTQIRLGDNNNFSSMYSRSGNSISRSRLGVEHE